MLFLMGNELPRLTRRRYRGAPSETWHIWYDGVRVGTIAAVKSPKGSHWAWTCGFHTGFPDGKERGGTAQSYSAAREAFEAAWANYLPTRTAADFDDWRHNQAWPSEKYAGWERGERGAPPWPLPGFAFRSKKNQPT